MRHWLELVLLGVIQGLTEFLPISSDGHLALGQILLGMKEDNLAITVALHSGTLLAVFVYFRRDLLRLARAVPSSLRGHGPVAERRMLAAIVAGSVPTAVLGLALKSTTQALSANLLAIGGFLVLSGAWSWMVVLRTKRGDGPRGPEALNLGDALAVGLVQGLAVLPGLSRSGSTIGMGVTLGLTRETAARFSFLLSLPAVAGALALEAKDISGIPSEQLLPILLGSVVSFAVGLGALSVLFRVLRAGRFDVFAFYCWALAAACFFTAFANRP